MSFAVWNARPPFAEADLTPGEKIYQIGPWWVVTDGAAPTQAQIDVLLGRDAPSQQEAARIAAIDDSIKTTSIGIMQPASVIQLKVMTVSEYSSWFDANFDTAAKLIALLKRLVLILIRRVL